ncbi:MAG: glycosyltransferase family 4 protein [Lachnospiraceae bacterium]|nr:glycosyltransferase family 4 protein [Lachnospiraceae bacterium]
MSEETKRTADRDLMREIRGRAAGRGKQVQIPGFVEGKERDRFDPGALEAGLQIADANRDLTTSFASPGGNPIKRLLKKICTKQIRFLMYRQNELNDAADQAMEQLYSYAVEEELRRSAAPSGQSIPFAAEQVIAAQNGLMEQMERQADALEEANRKLAEQLAKLERGEAAEPLQETGKKDKICFVCQRYGDEVNGGAEMLCMSLAERMVPYYDVEVLTSTATDYITWKNEYPVGTEELRGVTVHRFSVDREKDPAEFKVLHDRFLTEGISEVEEWEWLELQGPYTPTMIDFIREKKDDYVAFIFFTYLYYPTVMGVPEVPGKAIVFPLGHDEPPIRMKMFRQNVFSKATAYFFNTEEERLLVRSRFGGYRIPYLTGGTGLDLPEGISAARFRENYGDRLGNAPFIIYMGRIDASKNCGELFDFFLRYKKEHPSDLKLVLLGKAQMEIPANPDIVPLGFVSEQDKYDALAASDLLVLSSKFESLSIVVLEAMALHHPVLVNSGCEVLLGHCVKSDAGLAYSTYGEFAGSMDLLLNDPDLRDRMGENGVAYVHENYRWDTFVGRMRTMIELVKTRATKA